MTIIITERIEKKIPKFL